VQWDDLTGIFVAETLEEAHPPQLHLMSDDEERLLEDHGGSHSIIILRQANPIESRYVMPGPFGGFVAGNGPANRCKN
jgi:hypothetical protein